MPSLPSSESDRRKRRGRGGVRPATWSRSTFRRKLHLGDIHLQDFQPSGAVGVVEAVDHDLAVEPSGTQQGGIEYLRAIGGGEQDHAGARIEAIEPGELLLVIAARCVG